ncbi:VOC family protein [Hamadaea sp. NPDC051192]|uniref:VOC family protein n=1 Tax=Hamadaea sp. NPDC051192 TaxID=3154940 RepID=UPI00342897CC
MAYNFQVVVDSADPHQQADWWAETLGWEVEPSDEAFIRKMVAEGYATESDTRDYNGTLVWAAGQAIRHPEGLERAPRVLFQTVPEAKTVKNRLHLDVRVGEQNHAEVVAQLIERGATKLWDGRQGPSTWVTMADPEGNEFCVA